MLGGNEQVIDGIIKPLLVGRDPFFREAIWQAMKGNGDIYLDNYAGWYSVRDEAYYAEDELIEGENGEKLSPQGTPIEWVEEPSYFFKLSEWQDRLLEFYEANPNFIGPATRRNEVVSFVKGGLKDLSVSRTTFNWGVPVPDDDAHIMLCLIHL